MIAIAHYHDQPPFESPAKVWTEIKIVSPVTPIGEILEWAQNTGPYVKNHLIMVEIKEATK